MPSRPGAATHMAKALSAEEQGKALNAYEKFNSLIILYLS